MRSSSYNKRITIQQRTKVANEIGGWSNTWSDLFICWASVVQVSRFKRLEYAMLKYDFIYDVEMRKRLVNPDGDCRVAYDGNNYQILSFNADDKKFYMTIGR